MKHRKSNNKAVSKILAAVIFFCILLAEATSCNKAVEVENPVGVITAPQVFTSDAEATAAVEGIYYKLINTSLSYSSDGMTVFNGIGADELLLFNQSNPDYISFQRNNLTSNNNVNISFLWSNMYTTVYGANSVIDGLAKYSGVHASVKTELTGEAEFARAFANFYLTNLYGDVPLVTTINYNNTALLSRASQSTIYQSIVTDLKNAQASLAVDYSAGNNQRIVPNKWAATALLARVYLYQRDWKDAEDQATAVINNSGLYSLTPSVNDVFLVNSSEAIWQLQQSTKLASHNATPEGYLFVPRNATTQPFCSLANSLMNSFEAGDLRKTNWVNSTVFRGTRYYYPYKYKIGPGQASPGGAVTEYYMVLRLAEQYLIRAEAEAELGDLTSAAADLNLIRARAGLPNTTASTQSDMLTAIAHENQIEFFAEWGHRWLDLKRTGQATTVLSADKGFAVSANALLYPIPLGEIKKDPNLTQNPGY